MSESVHPLVSRDGRLTYSSEDPELGQIDTRLIQTAVIGGPDSDQPVILPEQPHNLDDFLRRFGRDDFWCGTLLGGCGEPLRAKRYVTKVCHFAHEPDPNRGECYRTTRSADGADHLFVKAHVTRWLAGQGYTVQGELRSHGHCHGDAVEFRLRRTKTHLRFELHPEGYLSWRKAADSLSAKEDRIEWVFGQDDALTRDMVARRGYVLLVRCETEDNDRRVLIGTVTDGKKTAWAPLEQCRMTGGGLVTPALEKLRAKGVIRDDVIDQDPLPGSLPLPGGQVVFAVDTESAPLPHSPFATADRYLVPGFVKPPGSRIVRAHLSLPATVPAPTEQYVYRLTGPVRLLVTDVVEGAGSLWAIRAEGLVPLNGLDAERTGLWRPSVALDERYAPAPRASEACERIPLAAPAPSRRKDPEIAPGRTAVALRKVLEEVAAKGATITWNELAARAGGGLLHTLPDSKRRELLAEVDKPWAPGRPLLSVLVATASGERIPYLGMMLRGLGADAPVSESALRQWAAAEAKKTHEAYGSGHARVPVAPLSGTVQSAAQKQTPPESDLRWAGQRRTEIREKLKQAAEIRAREKRGTTRAQRLSQVIQRGEGHLQKYEEVCRRRRDLRDWLVAGDQILDDLNRLIGRPITVTSAKTEQRTAVAEPKKARVPESKPDKKDPHLRKIRRLMGELGRIHKTGSTQEMQRLLDEVGSHRAQLAQPLSAADAKQVERWQRELETRRSSERSARTAAASRNTSPETRRTAQPPQEDRLPAERIDKLAVTVRGILQELARDDAAPLSWGELRRRTGGQMPPLYPDDRTALLVAVDRDTPADEPLLSTLVNTSDVSPHWLYRQVRLGLGRKPISNEGLDTHRAMEILRLRQIWRYRR
jgi:hypothetical protein